MKWLIYKIIGDKKVLIKINCTSFRRAKVCADYYRLQNAGGNCKLQIDVVNTDEVISTSWLQEQKYKHWIKQTEKTAK